jgi:acyl carrier protein
LGVRAQRVVLLRHGSAPRTTSGKIRRLACRTMLESGDLRALAEWQSEASPPPLAAGTLPDATRISDWVARWLAARLVLDAANLDTARPLQDFGLDSMAAIERVYALEDWLRLPIDATQLWRTATVQALAEHLAGALREPAAGPAAPEAAQAVAATLDHLVHSVESLSDDEVAAEFERRIGRG